MSKGESKSKPQFFKSSRSSLLHPLTVMHISNSWEISVLSAIICQGKGLQEKAYCLSDQWMKFLRKGRKEKAFRWFCKKLQTVIQDRLIAVGVPKTGYFSSAENAVEVKGEGVV